MLELLGSSGTGGGSSGGEGCWARSLVTEGCPGVGTIGLARGTERAGLSNGLLNTVAAFCTLLVRRVLPVRRVLVVLLVRRVLPVYET